jgi:chorismate lyase/3-hydroxybenzoate synthase
VSALPVDYVAGPVSNLHVVGVAPLPMRQLGPETLHEVWTGELFFGTYESADDEDIERAARIAYDEILRTARERGYPCLLRIWNHIRDINEGEGDAERYKRFCAGRHDAFDAAQWPNDMLPAASAVGIRQRGLVIYYLAARTPGRQIENPRQVSAYAYPRQYGRLSPSFARATVFGDMLFIAGTSSIVGHETKHPGDIRAQLDETLTNVGTIARAAGCRGLEDLTHVKLYLRNSADVEIANSVRMAMPQAKMLVLEADICRRELLLEIEAVGRCSPVSS